MGDGPFNCVEIQTDRLRFTKALCKVIFIICLVLPVGAFIIEFVLALHIGLNPLIGILKVNLYIVGFGMVVAVLVLAIIPLGILAVYCAGSPGYERCGRKGNNCLSVLGKCPFTILAGILLVLFLVLGIVTSFLANSAVQFLDDVCDPNSSNANYQDF